MIIVSVARYSGAHRVRQADSERPGPCPASPAHSGKGHTVTLGSILLIILIVLLVGSLPRWPHSVNWGYYPSGGVGLLLVIVIILLLMGRI